MHYLITVYNTQVVWEFWNKIQNAVYVFPYFATFTAPYNICVAIYNIVMYLSAAPAKIKVLQFAFTALSVGNF